MFQVGLKLNAFGSWYVSGRAETQLANTLAHLPGQASSARPSPAIPAQLSTGSQPASPLATAAS